MTPLSREATVEDISQMVEWGLQLHASSTVSHIPVDLNKCIATYTFAIQDPRGFAMVGDGGMFVGCLTEHWFSREITAQDVSIYVQPSARGALIANALIEAYVSWAKRMQATSISVGHFMSGRAADRAHAFFDKHGFVDVGVVFELVQR